MKAATPATRRRPDGVEDLCDRWTGPREDVFNVLATTRRHLSAKEIFSALRGSRPNLGLTTVYRTLDLLHRARLVRRVSAQSGEVRFEFQRADQADHHHHVICTNCGLIVNYRNFAREELELVRRTEAVLARKHGFVIQDHNIEFLGLCRDCRGPRGRRGDRTAGSKTHRPRAAGPAAPGRGRGNA